MDRDKRRERRQDRWVFTHRARFTNLLGVNCLKVGAGVTFYYMSCGLMPVFAAEADGRVPVTADANRPASEIRLKSIGADISLTPIGQASNATPNSEALRPHPSKIQLNPMTGDASHLLDQPVFLDMDTSSVDTSSMMPSTVEQDVSLGSVTGGSDAPLCCPTSDLCDTETETETPICETAGRASHPRILSMRLIDQIPSSDQPDRTTTEGESTIHDSRVPLAQATEPQIEALPSILETASVLEPDSETKWEVERAISFSFSDAADDHVAEPEEISNLPLLPVPNRQWVAAEVSASLSDRNPEMNAAQRRHPAEVAAPPTISVARVEGMSTHLPSATVTAKLAGYARPSRSATSRSATGRSATGRSGGVSRSLDSTVLMMNEIHKHYPDARVSLAHSDNCLVVRGNCRDRKQATAIIRLIRSRHLIPVDDQLVIR